MSNDSNVFEPRAWSTKIADLDFGAVVESFWTEAGLKGETAFMVVGKTPSGAMTIDINDNEIYIPATHVDRFVESVMRLWPPKSPACDTGNNTVVVAPIDNPVIVTSSDCVVSMRGRAKTERISVVATDDSVLFTSHDGRNSPVVVMTPSPKVARGFARKVLQILANKD